ncbi:MAG TPA: DUF4129 domain-containing protein [Chloroflexota bacterium]
MAGLGLVQDLLLLAGEAAWIYGWVLTVGAWIGGSGVPLLPLPILLLLLGASLVLARLASGRGDVRRGASVAAVAVGIVAVLFFAAGQLPPSATSLASAAAWNRLLSTDAGARAFLSGAAAGLVWWRGIGLGRVRPDVPSVEMRFRAGLVAISTLLALVGVSGGATRIAADALIVPTAVVLISGLVSMPLARIAEVSSHPRHRHGPGLAPGGPWLVMLFAVVIAILSATLVLAKLFTFERIGSALDAVGGGVDAILRLAIFVLAIPFGLLVEALIFLARLLIKPGGERPPVEQPQGDWLSAIREQGAGAQPSPELLLALKVALGLILAGLLAWIIWRAITRLQRMWEEEDVAEDRETVWTWPGWIALLRWLLSQLRPVGEKAAALVPRMVQRGSGEARTIRGIYRELLRLGAATGNARHLSETPLEYEERLIRVVPTGGDDVHAVSEAYAVSRYDRPGSPLPGLDALESHLARLRLLWAERVRG